MQLALALAAVLLGGSVPDFQVVDLQGGSHSFATLKGDLTVVAFIAVRCPVSNAYNQRMEALYKDYSAKGVKFVFVNANVNESSDEVKAHAQQVGFTFPVYRDSGNVADLFDAQVTPETFVIDKTGVLRYHGAIDDTMDVARVKKERLRTALDELLAGRPVTMAETKAFGCSVKRAHHRGPTE
jgi:thiol-disulfide isomerase/thioredoxin